MPILAIDVMRAEQISRGLFALQYPHVVGFGWHPEKKLCISVLHRHPVFYSVSAVFRTLSFKQVV